MSKGAIGFIDVDIFNLQVAVFRSDKARMKLLRVNGCEDPSAGNNASLASAHIDFVGGAPRLSMVIKPEATRATWVHECSHIADFMFEYLGIPPGAESTETRAYLMGHLFARLEGMMP